MAIQQEFVALKLSHFDVKAFDCGKPEMNQYLARFAVKNMGLNLSMTWVLPGEEMIPDQKTSIAAYYTLASCTVTREEIPTGQRLPGYPVPVVLLARLAVDLHFQGQRVGEKSLISALRHSVTLTERGLPAIGFILDVIDEDALAFYQKFDLFEPFTDNPMRLFVPMNVVQQI